MTVAYNVYRFHDALQFGYRPPVDPGFTTPLLEGARGLLLSPEKSVVLFAPAIVLVPLALVALWRRQRALVALLLALFAATFVLAATWWSWQGGWSWGPRLLIPGVAVVLAALGPWIGTSRSRLRLAAALFALGFVLSFSAVLAPAGAQLLGRAPGTDGPQLVRQYRVLPQLTRRSIDAAGDPPPATPTTAGTSGSGRPTSSAGSARAGRCRRCSERSCCSPRCCGSRDRSNGGCAAPDFIPMANRRARSSR